MATGWSSEETRTLLGIWGAADVQAQLDGKVQRKIEAVEPEKEPWHSPSDVACMYSYIHITVRVLVLHKAHDATRPLHLGAISVACVYLSGARYGLISCPTPYFSGIGSGNIAYIELFQWNSIIVYVTT